MRRKVGLVLVFGAALPLAVASVAWACGVLATLTLDTKVAAPGQAVTVTGKNYGRVDQGASPVTVRLKSRTGAVLTTTTTTTGKISDTFTLPASTSPGWYVVLATQNNANGTPKSGTPGRTTLRVQGAAHAKNSAVVAAPWSSSGPGGPAGSTAPSADAAGSGSQSLLTILLAAALSLTMLASGWALLSRRSRTVTEPQFGV